MDFFRALENKELPSYLDSIKNKEVDPNLPIWKQRMNTWEQCNTFSQTYGQKKCDQLATEFYGSALTTFHNKTPISLWKNLDSCALKNPKNPVACEEQVRACWEYFSSH